MNVSAVNTQTTPVETKKVEAACQPESKAPQAKDELKTTQKTSLFKAVALGLGGGTVSTAAGVMAAVVIAKTMKPITGAYLSASAAAVGLVGGVAGGLAGAFAARNSETRLESAKKGVLAGAVGGAIAAGAAGGAMFKTAQGTLVFAAGGAIAGALAGATAGAGKQ